jgi:hypothetical protein
MIAPAAASAGGRPTRMSERPTCARCGKPLRPDDVIVARLGRVYHARCFPDRSALVELMAIAWQSGCSRLTAMFTAPRRAA